ncbi:NACHT domain- and WD repeat-containing protein 1-like [Lineus longissimus]|uniref:NACHT domain- and WD repeat-containing protein 1-like n=1 Tax=Lineus longissimus TaxID=88925 RepID=UPI002B4F2908
MGKKKEGQDLITAALCGELDVDYPSITKIVKIYISSALTDTEVERNMLAEKVYPRIRTFCEEKGYEFQAVDLRWGVLDEWTHDHTMPDLCLREIEDCQNQSMGPNFITFLAQKYGSPAFPSKISSVHFEELVAATPDSIDSEMLKTWFKLDENCLPLPQYTLVPITENIPNYCSADAGQRKEAVDEWEIEFKRIQDVLQTVAQTVFEGNEDMAEEKHQFFRSLIEQELALGLLNADNSKECCHWFKRSIENLREHWEDEKATMFLDIHQGMVDNIAVGLLSKLVQDQILAKLHVSNITSYKIDWNENGVNIEDSKDHEKYTEKLLDDFYETVCSMISNALPENDSEQLESSHQEVVQHINFAKSQASSFLGREKLLGKVEEYIKSGDKTLPLVIHGESGSGKSALMAKVAELIPSWYTRSEQVVVVVRFLGATSASTSIRQLLISLSLQLAEILDEEVPDNLSKLKMKEIKKAFHELLKAVKLRKKVFLLLDGVDQLDGTNHGQEMDWLPLPVPSDTFTVVLSTLSDEETEIMPVLKERLKDKCFLDIETLDEDDLNLITKESLKTMERTLIPSQMTLVQDATKANPNPLYLKMVLDAAARWKSYNNTELTVLEDTVPEMMKGLFERLETVHGERLVSHALGYITCARNGLSENELLDLLSCDDLVLNDVYEYFVPPLRRFPPLLWARIKFELRGYLTHHGADGVQVLNWCHQQFAEVARARYLSDRDTRIRLYKTMVEFFLGKWADGFEKPFLGKTSESGGVVQKGGGKGSKRITLNLEENEADRFVKSQPLIYKEGATPKETVFNLRKMSELPYALVMSEQADMAKSEVFCNLTWLYNKAKALGLESILDDFEMAGNSPLYDDADINIVRRVFQQAGEALHFDINQMPVQLTARILSATGDLSPAVKALLKQAQNPPFPCLLTKQAFLPLKKTESDGDSSSHLLDSHENQVKLTTLSHSKTKLVTFTVDRVLRIWDVASGSELHKLDFGELKGSGDPDSIILCHNDELVISGCRDKVEFFSVESGDLSGKKVKIEQGDLLNAVPILYYEPKDWLLVLSDVNLVVWAVEDLQLIGEFDVGKASATRHHQAKDFFDILGSKVGAMRAATHSMKILDIESFVANQTFLGEFNIEYEEDRPMLTRCTLLPQDKLACMVYGADHKEREEVHKPAVLFIFSLEGNQLAKYPVFSVDYALGCECLIPVEEEDHVLFLNFDSSYNGSILYDIDINSGSYTIKYKQVGNITHVNYIGNGRASVLNHESNTKVQIRELKIEDPHEGLSDEALVTAEYKEEVETIFILPSTMRYVAASYRVFCLVVWDLAEMQAVRILNTENASIYTSLMQFPTASLGVSVTGKKQLVTFDMKTLEKFGPHDPSFGGQPRPMSFDIVDSKLALGTSKDEHALVVKDVKTGKTVASLKCKPNEQIKHMIVSGNGQVVLAFTSDPKYAIVWDLTKKKRLPDLGYKDMKLEVLAKKGVAVSHNGQFAAAIDKQHTRNFVIWEVATGDVRECKRPVGTRGDSYVLGMSRKLQAVVVGYVSGYIGIFNMKSLTCDAYLHVSTNKLGIGKLVLSEDGSLAACNGEHSGMVVVVDLIEKICLASLTIESTAWDYQFTRDNQFLMLGGGSIKGIVQLFIHRGRDEKKKVKQTLDKTMEALRKKDAFYGQLKMLEYPQS